MRIGVVTTSYPRWLGDHAGSFVEGHADALRDLGHEVEIIAAGDSETPRNRTAEQQEVHWRVELRERERRESERRAAENVTHEIDLREGDRREGERRTDLGREGRTDVGREGRTDIGREGRTDVGREGRTDIGREGRTDVADLGREGPTDVGREHRTDVADLGHERRRRPIVIVTENVITREGRVVRSDDGDGRAVRVPSRGLFYQGGAPEAFERSSWRAMRAAATFLPRFAATVAKHARNWDHIIAHWLAPSALAALPTGKPITAIAHGGDIYTLRRFGLLKPALFALRNAKLVFVSEELRRIANVDGIVQPMGVDLAHFASIGRAPTTPPTVLFVGRLVPIKGVDTLIEAMAHLPRAWRLVIAGDGPERRALEARARRTNATFLGAVSTGQRDRLLREASVVAVPSRTIAGRTEGCPTIALEALASGVPVVATVGRACEKVRPDDAVGLARGIERAIGRTETASLVRDLDWMTVAARLLRNE